MYVYQIVYMYTHRTEIELYPKCDVFLESRLL